MKSVQEQFNQIFNSDYSKGVHDATETVQRIELRIKNLSFFLPRLDEYERRETEHIIDELENKKARLMAKARNEWTTALLKTCQERSITKAKE